MRKLVTLRKIANLAPIEGADLIEVATVDGWEVIVKKGEFQVGDFAIYFEIDSFLPKYNQFSHMWSFLEARGVKVLDGKEGYRLKTIKMKGQVSQGLLLPVPEGIDTSVCYEEQVDLSEHFGVVKWEVEQAGTGPNEAKGTFPHFIPKTDEERVQNIFGKIDPEADYIPTMKLDGSSITVFCDLTGKYTGQPYYVGVCSRNQEIKFDPENRFWKGALNSGLIRAVVEMANECSTCVALQGELMGPGIQKNREGLKEYKVYVFNIFYPDDFKYGDWYDVRADSLCFNFDVVPVIHYETSPVKEFGSVKALLEHAEGPSINHPIREGVVWKKVSGGGPESFKVISNKYLLKGGE